MSWKKAGRTPDDASSNGDTAGLVRGASERGRTSAVSGKGAAASREGRVRTIPVAGGFRSVRFSIGRAVATDGGEASGDFSSEVDSIGVLTQVPAWGDCCRCLTRGDAAGKEPAAAACGVAARSRGIGMANPSAASRGMADGAAANRDDRGSGSSAEAKPIGSAATTSGIHQWRDALRLPQVKRPLSKRKPSSHQPLRLIRADRSTRGSPGTENPPDSYRPFPVDAAKNARQNRQNRKNRPGRATLPRLPQLSPGCFVGSNDWEWGRGRRFM